MKAFGYLPALALLFITTAASASTPLPTMDAMRLGGILSHPIVVKCIEQIAVASKASTLNPMSIVETANDTGATIEVDYAAVVGDIDSQYAKLTINEAMVNVGVGDDKELLVEDCATQMNIRLQAGWQPGIHQQSN